MGSMPMDSMPLASACAGSSCASRPAGSPSQQISIQNGRSPAGMNPGGMSTRDDNATSMMLAISVRLLHLPRFKRISQAFLLAAEFYQQNRNNVSADMASPQPAEVVTSVSSTRACGAEFECRRGLRQQPHGLRHGAQRHKPPSVGRQQFDVRWVSLERSAAGLCPGRLQIWLLILLPRRRTLGRRDAAGRIDRPGYRS
jgi:hypothetical protein